MGKMYAEFGPLCTPFSLFTTTTTAKTMDGGADDSPVSGRKGWSPPDPADLRLRWGAGGLTRIPDTTLPRNRLFTRPETRAAVWKHSEMVLVEVHDMINEGRGYLLRYVAFVCKYIR